MCKVCKLNRSLTIVDQGEDQQGQQRDRGAGDRRADDRRAATHISQDSHGDTEKTE